MMAIRQYTRDELLHLRESPLIAKPENLPAIEQWLEYVYVDRDSREKLRIPHSEAQQQQQQTHNAANQTKRKTPGEASPMGNFGAGSSRPSLLATRSHGGSRTGGESELVYPGFVPGLMRARVDDVSLGPSKTIFASSRNVHKLGDGEKNGDGEEQEGPRSRFFGGDKSNRKSLNEKEGGHTRVDWTRRGMGADEEKSDSRWGRREKDGEGERRNGYGDRHEPRWGEKRQNGEKQGGWRDRERERREPEWNRDNRPEKEPEWMDDPAPNGDDDLRTMGMPRNQEQFQKWKEAMSGKKTQAEPPPPEPEPTPTATAQKATAAPLKLDGFVDKGFGGWGEGRPPVSMPEGAPSSAKGATAKGKGSRFASIFKESQAKEEPPPPLPETGIQAIAGQVANGAAEDEAGFKRILQMLGNTTVSQPAATPEGPSSPQPKANANGSMKQKSRFTGFFDQAGPKSPERMQSPPEQVAPRHLEDIFASSRGMPQEGSGMFGGPPEPRYNDQGRGQLPSMTSPEPPPGLNGGNQRSQQSSRMNDLFLEQPPSRGTGTPDVHVQNLLAAQQRVPRPQAQDNKNSEFLLNLLQMKGSSRPPSQQARPDNFSLWLDQPNNMPEPHAPKPRVPPPPGLFEDQLLRNTPLEPQRQDAQQMHGNEMPHRRQSQRAAPGVPPGFYDEQSMFMQQQQARRNYVDQPQQPQQPGRRMSGHPNLPQMQIPPGMQPQQQQYGGPPPPDFIQSPTGGPPPGFNPHMARHPSGLGNIPNIFQAPQQHGRGEQPPPPPPGFGGSGVGGMQSPPGAGMPPGYYGPGPGGVPPGFPAMRGPEGMAAGGGRGRPYEGVHEGMGGRR